MAGSHAPSPEKRTEKLAGVPSTGAAVPEVFTGLRGRAAALGAPGLLPMSGPGRGLPQVHAASGWCCRSGKVLYRPREAQLISCQGSYYGGITGFTGPGNRVMGLLSLNGGDS